MAQSHVYKARDIISVLIALSVLATFFITMKDRSVSQAKDVVTQEQLKDQTEAENSRDDKTHNELRQMIAENAKQIRELTQAVSELKGYASAQRNRGH